MCSDDGKPDINDLGLQADVKMMSYSPVGRRRILRLGAVGATLLLTGGTKLWAQSNGVTAASLGSYLPLVMNGAATATVAPTATTTATPTATACVTEIPQETAGPYPADGSNASNQALNALALSGIVRSDVRTSLGTKNVAAGIPTTVVLTLVNSNANCAPLAGYALYLWHCTREGKYSLYSNGVTSEDYLRGVQAADGNGTVTFTTIFPACYSGRWPHMHFEIYPSLAIATSASNAIHTSQLALPQSTCNEVYATTGYSASVQNLSQVSLSSDNVFRDGTTLQMPTVAGDTTNGYTVRLTVGVSV